VPDILGDLLGSPDSAIRASLRYDYSQIAEASRSHVQAAAVAIVRSGRKAQESLIDIGQRLATVKEMLPHGQFSDWCQTEFEMSLRTAQRMMAVAETFGGKSDTVSFLSDSALYLLSGPSVPEEARQEVIDAAQAAGASPTKTQVQAVIDKHKPAPPSYASVWEIQSKVGSVIAQKWPDGKQSATWISAMRAAARTTGSALLHDVEEALEQAGIEYRRRDLVQAINNVADTLEQELKRRQAAPAPPPAAPPSAPIAAAPIDIPIKRAATPPTYDDLCKLIAARPNLKASDLRSAIRQRRGHWLFDTIMANVETAHPGAWSQTRVVNAMIRVAEQMDADAAPAPAPTERQYESAAPAWVPPGLPGGRVHQPAAPLPTRVLTVGIDCHTWEGYADWNSDDEAEYAALNDRWQNTSAPGINFMNELNRFTRWRVAARIATQIFDNRAFSVQEAASRLYRKERYEAERATRPGQLPADAATPSEAAGVTAASDGIDDDEATAFAVARIHLGDALTSLKAAKSVLGGWHDELANMLDEIAAHVRHAVRKLD
jgi:hypothetical protein